METLSSDNPVFWQSRYQSQQTPWDLGTVSPPFVGLMQTENALIKPGKMAVVGCGYGHDAAFFARQGFEVIGIDYAAEAVTAAQQTYGQWAQYLQADLFDLPQAVLGQFDYVLEHTCFCAILPNRRPDYVKAVHSLLKPTGHFIGLFWAHQEEGGPPYKTDEAEIKTLFSPYFIIQHLDPVTDSIEGRKGQERLAIFARR
jgi:methyl halide transferase